MEIIASFDKKIKYFYLLNPLVCKKNRRIETHLSFLFWFDENIKAVEGLFEALL